MRVIEKYFCFSNYNEDILIKLWKFFEDKKFIFKYPNLIEEKYRNIAYTRSDRYIYPILSRYESSDCSDLFSII